MQIKRVKLLYFSPTGNVRRTLRKIAEGTGWETAEYDLTSFGARWQNYIFTAEDLALIGMPVYYGRIPAIAGEILRGIRAGNTPAVFVVSYGNRDYEDALLELKQKCEQKGFAGIAAAAFIGEHSCCPGIAAGRPDLLDEEKALFFGREIRKKVADVVNISMLKNLQVKGKYPYRQSKERPVCPVTADHCDSCGLCSRECPVLAINPADPKETDSFRCLICFRCIRNCPNRAKYIENDKFNNLIAELEKNCTVRKEPEIFI